MTDLILKNFELLDPEIGELKSGYEILISDGEIKKVFKGNIKYRNATIYDLAGFTLILGIFIKSYIGNLLTRASALVIVIIMCFAFYFAHKDWFINSKFPPIFLLEYWPNR